MYYATRLLCTRRNNPFYFRAYMHMLKEALLKDCIQILKRDDVKQEIKKLVSPLIDLVMLEVYPYLYLCLMFVLISFLLHLGIFVLLIRNKPVFQKA